MPRETLDRRLQHLRNEVLMLGGMVEQAVLRSVDALKRRDLNESNRIYEEDAQINEVRYAIENAIIIMIATQQPIAKDLRLLASFLEISTELERIGDYAKGISKVNLRYGDNPFPIALDDIETMAELGTDMLRRALRAFVDEDVAAASRIPPEDDKVDALYNKVYRDLVNAMIAKPEIIDYANLLMWVSHNLERLADRVTNICERTVFIATGDLYELDSDLKEEISD